MIMMQLCQPIILCSILLAITRLRNRRAKTLDQGVRELFCEGADSTNLGSEESDLPLAATQFCHDNMKTAQKYLGEWE